MVHREEGHRVLIDRVDFHIQDEAGHVLALVGADQLHSLTEGQTVFAKDYEGNRVKAEVVAIERPRSLVILELQPGSFEPSSLNDWIAEDHIAAAEGDLAGVSPEYDNFERLLSTVVKVPKEELKAG